MDINDAFIFHHIKKETYTGNINYSKMCIYCSHQESSPLLTNGSFRKCLQCKKHFNAIILTEPIKNYNNSINK
jgi:hypothetical protein